MNEPHIRITNYIDKEGGGGYILKYTEGRKNVIWKHFYDNVSHPQVRQLKCELSI